VSFTPSPFDDACAFCGSGSHGERQCTQRLIRAACMRQTLRREEGLGWAPPSGAAGGASVCDFCAQHGHREPECEFREMARELVHRENGVKIPRRNH